MGKDLSVVIVNWNTRELVLESLRCLYMARGALSMEVFVVDNGSRDSSVQAVRAAFPEVIVIEKERNLGFAKANNEALRRAVGRYFLLLNTDVMVYEEAVAALVEFMAENPQVGVVGAQLLNPDGTMQNSFDNFPTLLSEGLNKSLLRILFPKRFPSKRTSLSSSIEVECVIGACMMVRRETVDDVGLMDEDYFFFMEETDWCYRMRQKGWKVYLIPHARAVHLQGGTADRVKAQAKVEYYRSRYLFFEKYRGRFSTGILWGILVFKLLINVFVNGLICLCTFFRYGGVCRRTVINWKLFVWHILLCPDSYGLKEP